jgi:hypothetical protein
MSKYAAAGVCVLLTDGTGSGARTAVHVSVLPGPVSAGEPADVLVFADIALRLLLATASGISGSSASRPLVVAGPDPGAGLSRRRQISRCTGMSRGMSLSPGMNGMSSSKIVARPVM